MRREGQPFSGTMTVAWKTAADLCTGLRFPVFIIVAALPATLAIPAVSRTLPGGNGAIPGFSYLRIFGAPLAASPSFADVLWLLLPLMAIAFMFDAANGVDKRRSMGRALARPIYRDAWLAGTFVGGLLALVLACLLVWLLVIGFGILGLGIPPAENEIVRSLAWLLCAALFATVWLALSLGLSVMIALPVQSALVALLVWVLLMLAWPAAATHLASGAVSPAWLDGLVRHPPATVLDTIDAALLGPHASPSDAGALTTGALTTGALIDGTALTTGQSALAIWREVTGLVVAILLLFTAAYIAFQRRAIRI